VLVLDNPIQDYAWGATDGLSELVGTEPTGGPEAELWIGAHPSAPSTLADGRTLDLAVSDDPDALLGSEVTGRFGPRLPFLLKVLAIGAPLSLQLHPSTPQAEEGFAREEGEDVAIDDARRTYKDPFAKPELLVALAPTWVLVGLRSGSDAASALRRLGDPALEDLIDLVADGADARDGLVHLLDAEDPARAALTAAAARADGGADPAAAWVRKLAAAHPDDPTALAPLLLDLVHLSPGDGIFLPAGVPHAYLEGAGVELMAASDNVVRGGLTAKHVDRRELVRLLAPPGTDALAMDGGPSDDEPHCYLPPVPDIALRRVEPRGDEVEAPVDGPGPALVLATGGSAAVSIDGQVVELGRGRAVLVPPAERSRCRLSGTGPIWWATVGEPSPSR